MAKEGLFYKQKSPSFAFLEILLLRNPYILCPILFRCASYLLFKKMQKMLWILKA